MAEKRNIHFPCPNCGDKFARLKETGGDFHAGEIYRCAECGGPVVFVALSLEMLADPTIIRWDCHFCQPGPCRLAPSRDGADGPQTEIDEPN